MYISLVRRKTSLKMGLYTAFFVELFEFIIHCNYKRQMQYSVFLSLLENVGGLITFEFRMINNISRIMRRVAIVKVGYTKLTIYLLQFPRTKIYSFIPKPTTTSYFKKRIYFIYILFMGIGLGLNSNKTIEYTKSSILGVFPIGGL